MLLNCNHLDYMTIQPVIIRWVRADCTLELRGYPGIGLVMLVVGTTADTAREVQLSPFETQELGKKVINALNLLMRA